VLSTIVRELWPRGLQAGSREPAFGKVLCSASRANRRRLTLALIAPRCFPARRQGVSRRRRALSSEIQKPVLTYSKNQNISRPSPRHQRDVSRSSRNVVRVAMGVASVRQAQAGRAKRWQRTAKSCGPGAATLALRWREVAPATGARKAASPGRARISRKTIARGRPGCLGCTCSRCPCVSALGMPVCSSARDLRAQSAPGLPCALCSEEGQ